mgnify:FL=1
METIAKQVAKTAVELKYEDLPDYAVEHAKMLTLDVLAYMVGTRNIITSQIARENAEEIGGPDEGPIVGSSKKLA